MFRREHGPDMAAKSTKDTEGRNPLVPPELLWEFKFAPSTPKPGMDGLWTVETGHVTPLSLLRVVSKSGFVFLVQK